jgi:hypothetical protein
VEVEVEVSDAINAAGGPVARVAGPRLGEIHQQRSELQTGVRMAIKVEYLEYLEYLHGLACSEEQPAVVLVYRPKDQIVSATPCRTCQRWFCLANCISTFSTRRTCVYLSPDAYVLACCVKRSLHLLLCSAIHLHWHARVPRW